MNYEKHYQNLIDTRKMLNRIKKVNDGFELHHILPKCLGGTNDSSNLILLTTREHFIAHWLLYKMHHGKDKAKMAYAFFMMCNNNTQQKRNVTSRQFETARVSMVKSTIGVNHPNFGKNPFTDMQIKEISRRQSGSNNSMYGKIPWNKGKKLRPRTEQEKQKVSAKLKGRPRSNDVKEKISLSHIGKSKTNEHKEKLRQANIGKPRDPVASKKTGDALRGKKHRIIVCPHCGNSGGYTAMKRWHFERCDKNGRQT